MELLRRFSFTLLLMTLTTLAGCGGEDGGFSIDGNNSEDNEESTINLLLTIDEINVNNINPAFVTATLEDDGTPLSGKVITFTASLGALIPSSGTVLTDINGQATIEVTPGEVEGAGTISASYDEVISSPIGFSTAGDSDGSEAQINLSLTDVDGNEIEQVSSTLPGKLVATVTGVSKSVIVTFNTDIGSIPIPTAIATTGSGYVATVDLLASQSLGAGTVTAELASGESEQLVFSIGASSLGIGHAIDATTGLPDGLIDVPTSAISAGATAGLSVSIWDISNATAATPATLFSKETVEVTFSSGCSGLFIPTASIDSPVATIEGTAQSTYLAQGCVGNDIVTATANIGGSILSATGTVSVNSPISGSIEFFSATPENISLKGVGGTESSMVTFRVKDTNGNVVANKSVNFSLNTEVGGIILSQFNATSDSNGLVQTVVNAGTVNTSVRVRAELNEASSIFTQSSLLVISTGIPDQDSFSLSASTLNVEGWSRDGTEVEVIARLADAFNNPVPDGTAVSFTTEGGSIEPFCTTENGACSVTWTSQFPRPAGKELFDENRTPEKINTMGQPYGGRVTILATAIGEESFPDLNGNGRFDIGEMAAFSGNDVSGNPYDLAEAFVDHNEDGKYNPSDGGDVNDSGALEEFIDFDNSGTFSPKDGEYNGSLCGDANNCSTEKSINVRGSLVLVMSGSNPVFTMNTPVNGTEINSDEGDEVAVEIVIADLHNQPMPAGTIVTFEAVEGSIVGESSYTWPNTNKNGGSSFVVTLKGVVSSSTLSGELIVTVTTPSGVVTFYNQKINLDITSP